MGEEQGLIDAKLARLQTWLTAGVAFIVAFAVTITAVMFWQAVVLNRKTEGANVALCTFRHDLEVRYETSLAFIDNIRTGKRPPISGITIPDLERSAANQKATLDSLSALDC